MEFHRIDYITVNLADINNSSLGIKEWAQEIVLIYRFYLLLSFLIKGHNSSKLKIPYLNF